MPGLQADIHKKSRDIRNLLLLLVHNQIAVAQLVRDGLIYPDISKSPPHCLCNAEVSLTLLN